VLSGEESEGAFQLSWTAAVIGSAPIDFYRLYRSVDGGAFDLLFEASALDLQYLDTDIDFLTYDTYDYRVVAYAEDGGVSPDSNVVSFEEPEPPGDPDFASVVLLLHFDGAALSTSFPDSSNYNNDAFSASSVLTTDTPQFGTACLDCNGGSAQVPGTVSDAINIFDGGDFTIEGWMRTPNAAAQGIIFDYGDYVLSDSGIRLYTNEGFLFLQASAFHGWSDVQNDLVPILSDTWYHFAVVRRAERGYLYVNGLGKPAGPSPNWFNADVATNFNDVSFGASSNSGIQNTFFLGNVDEVRVTKGIARYAADFTPPTQPFPDA